MTDLVPSPSYGSNAALVTFLIYTLGVLFLAWMSNRLRKTKSFLSEYFLGSRSLGVWAFALTFAATSASGGSFTGFPSKIYTHGWILGFWIGSYIVVPICGMGLLGKRINQIARRTGAITVPDILRDRFESAGFGLLCTVMIIFFMSVNLVAQFKSGSLILKTLLLDVPFFRSSVLSVAEVSQGLSLTEGVDPAYLLCLLTFAVAVILYTTYGGFHAVVWTDVMQGVVMVTGVVVMLPLALIAVGGLDSATQRLGRMVPPRLGVTDLELSAPSSEDTIIRSGVWLTASDEKGEPRLLRISQEAVIPQGSTRAREIQAVEITSEEEAASIREQLAAGTLPSAPPSVSATRIATEPYRSGADSPGVYVSGTRSGPLQRSGVPPPEPGLLLFLHVGHLGNGPAQHHGPPDGLQGLRHPEAIHLHRGHLLFPDLLSAGDHLLLRPHLPARHGAGVGSDHAGDRRLPQ